MKSEVVVFSSELLVDVIIMHVDIHVPSLRDRDIHVSALFSAAFVRGVALAHIIGVPEMMCMCVCVCVCVV